MNVAELDDAPAHVIADAVRNGAVTALAVTQATMRRIDQRNPGINAFTAIARDRALAHATRIDAARRTSPATLGPLCGVPFAVKAMIDVAGLVTTAGSALHAGDAPASRDAAVVRKLEGAGAVCVGALNMDEFGMGGTTESSHFGATRNPHDTTRTPGGSSGGSAAALAAGMVPLALGADALGSIRLPASLCGVYGLRPTRGSIPQSGVMDRGGTISTVGPMARNVRDVALSHALMVDALPRPPDARNAGTTRIARATGYFSDRIDTEAGSAVGQAVQALGTAATIEIPQADRARAAAILINSSESAIGRLPALRQRANAFHPGTRDRFIAHALLPVQWYLHAQRFRQWHKARVLELFERVDVIVLPATPCVAPPLGQATLRIGDTEYPTGPMLGWFTQPLAGVDCPVLTVPIARPGRLPIGIQLLAAPNRETLLFDVAARLEALGVAAAPIARFE